MLGGGKGPCFVLLHAPGCAPARVGWVQVAVPSGTGWLCLAGRVCVEDLDTCWWAAGPLASCPVSCCAQSD